VGTGLGAGAGGATGAAIGSIGGPIGAGVGLVVGAIAGGYAGKGVAEVVDPTLEDEYWRTEYSKRDYADQNTPYENYQPAYRAGYEGYGRYPGKTFDQVEADLQRDYEKSAANADMKWDRARYATRDAWDRVEKNRSCDDGCGCG
jgi:hypothetical protein